MMYADLISTGVNILELHMDSPSLSPGAAYGLLRTSRTVTWTLPVVGQNMFSF